MATDTAAVTLRRFDRTWTQRVGVLEEALPGTGLPPAAARLLVEVGPAGADPAALRERLGLDAARLSRLLRRLESAGLVVREADPADARRRRAALTPAGLRALAQLEARSDALAARIVEALGPRQRGRLDEALRTADLLVRAATLRLTAVDPAGDAAQHAIGRYFAELVQRLPGGFDPGDPGHDGPFVVALDDDRPVAAGGLRALGDARMEVKRLWVDPAWRGAGLGTRMLSHLEALARAAGCDRVLLDTNGVLTEAIALYDRSGYRRIARYNDNPHAEAFFEKALG